MTKYTVYLLIAKRKNYYISYVGYSNNVRKRLHLHNNSKGAKFTKGNIWTLIYKKDYNSKNIALKEEYKLKKNNILRNKIKEKYIKNAKKNIYHSSV